jgi:lipoprotein-anchoring transpeptidase ErfK/SrfK
MAGGGGRRLGGLAAVAVAAGAATVAVAAVTPASSPERASRGGRALPAPVTPAFVPGPPRPLAVSRHLARWAPVRRAVLARAAPDAAAPVVAPLATRTPEGSANVVSVLEHRQTGPGQAWVRVGLSVLPHGTSGWVPRSALGGYGTVDTRLDVDLGRLRATLFRAGRPVLRAVIGAGMSQWPTPTGRFYIRNKLTRYRSPAYGPVAFGTSARSATLTDWPAGGFVGIHGTDRPDLLPGRVSHGCIRLRNADILALARLMPVGTPITVH